jgi:hypothetical protein
MVMGHYKPGQMSPVRKQQASWTLSRQPQVQRCLQQHLLLQQLQRQFDYHHNVSR